MTQFHFTAWPDHGVPDYATSILMFHSKVISAHKSSDGPILVHCRYINSYQIDYFLLYIYLVPVWDVLELSLQ